MPRSTTSTPPRHIEIEDQRNISLPLVNVVPSSPPIPHSPPANVSLTAMADEQRISQDGKARISMETHSILSRDFTVSPTHPELTTRPPSLIAISPAPMSVQLPTGNNQSNTLAALSIGAPLISSVVISCLALMRDEISAAFGDNIRSRPFSAQATFAIMWSATVTSLGSTMIAVVGLALAAGYHDSHVGMTKMIIRRIRAWRRKSKGLGPVPVDHSHGRAPSRAHTDITTATVQKRERHALAALRAAEVSARLLSASVSLLAVSLAIHLFTIYSWGVGFFVLVVALVTAALCMIPILSVIIPST